MIAHLGMYDMPALRPANAAFWREIRAALGFGPQDLTASDDFYQIWTDPDLLFSQTCGYPYRARLHGKVQLIGTPDYGLPQCPPGYYCSVLIAHAEDPRDNLGAFADCVFAYNEALSQSGWAGPIHFLSDHGITPRRTLRSGGHMFSAALVASKRADLAGIDALTWALLEEHDPALTTQLRVLTRTPPTPALPFITGFRQDVKAVQKALYEAIEALDPVHRAALHLQGCVEIGADAYLNVATPPPPP